MNGTSLWPKADEHVASKRMKNGRQAEANDGALPWEAPLGGENWLLVNGFLIAEKLIGICFLRARLY